METSNRYKIKTLIINSDKINCENKNEMLNLYKVIILNDRVYSSLNVSVITTDDKEIILPQVMCKYLVNAITFTDDGDVIFDVNVLTTGYATPINFGTNTLRLDPLMQHK